MFKDKNFGLPQSLIDDVSKILEGSHSPSMGTPSSAIGDKVAANIPAREEQHKKEMGEKVGRFAQPELPYKLQGRLPKVKNPLAIPGVTESVKFVNKAPPLPTRNPKIEDAEFDARYDNYIKIQRSFERWEEENRRRDPTRASSAAAPPSNTTTRIGRFANPKLPTAPPKPEPQAKPAGAKPAGAKPGAGATPPDNPWEDPGVRNKGATPPDNPWEDPGVRNKGAAPPAVPPAPPAVPPAPPAVPPAAPAGETPAGSRRPRSRPIPTQRAVEKQADDWKEKVLSGGSAEGDTGSDYTPPPSASRRPSRPSRTSGGNGGDWRNSVFNSDGA